MKRILLLALLLLCSGCHLDRTTYNVSLVTYNIEHNGHAYILFKQLVGSSIGLVHDPDCPCHKAQSPDLTDWQALTLAIALTESRCNPEATGSCQDAGILQLTPIYVKEANRVGGTNYVHSDAYDPLKSLYMFNMVQDYHNPEHDQNKALKLHNPGGASIGYPQKVKQNLELIKRIEAVRSALIEYEHRKGNANPARGERAL